MTQKLKISCVRYFIVVNMTVISNKKYYKQYFYSVHSWRYLAMIGEMNAVSITVSKNKQWTIESIKIDISYFKHIHEISSDEFNNIVNEIKSVLLMLL